MQRQNTYLKKTSGRDNGHFAITQRTGGTEASVKGGRSGADSGQNSKGRMQVGVAEFTRLDDTSVYSVETDSHPLGVDRH